MESAAEVRRNLHELQNLRSMASRPFVKNVLDREITGCQKRLEELQEVVTPLSGDGPATSSSVSSKTVTVTGLYPTVKITNYAWDQSDKYVKLYLSIPKMQSAQAEQFKADFSENSFDINAFNIEGKNYSMIVKGLLHEIDPASSYIKKKTDSLLVMLKKRKESQNWAHLTKAEMSSKEKSVPKFDEKADPQESLMNMMKQMYDEGDDDMKRTIRKAWHESQSKKTANLGEDV